MTHHETWTEEHVPASDLWAIPKSMEPMTPEEAHEAWRKTVKALDSLCGMAEGLMLEPLVLALADALGRSREELARAQDRITRPQGAELAPREDERLRALLRRSDAFNNALAAVEAEEGVLGEVRAECVAVLEEAGREAQEAFTRYREEVGITA